MTGDITAWTTKPARSRDLVSSRTPAPDDFPSMAMPDLPTDLFEDDEPFYAPADETSYARDYGTEETPWDDDLLTDVDHPALNDDDYDGYIDDKPRRRQRRGPSDRMETDPRARRRSRRPDDFVEEETDRPRRKPRRVPQDGAAGESRQRPRVHRDSGPDDLAMESVDVEAAWDTPSYDPPRRRAPQGRQQPIFRQDRRPARQDRVIEEPRMRMEAATTDIVTSVRPSARPGVQRSRAPKPRNPAWEWRPIVMPQPRQMLEQALPSLLMAVSLFGTLGILGFMPGGMPLWAPLILIPTLLLLFRANQKVHPMWTRSAIINLVVVGAFFPMMIVRQSFLRVPFVEFGNGTLVMPILSTVLVVVAMAVIALGAAFLTQDDPEYAGMLFLPAAMLVPFFAGATEITGLGTALAIIGSIYVACAVLTVIASMLPAAFPTLVAPIALALEFLVLPVSASTPIFPVGAGMSAKLMFFVVLAMGVGLTVAVPMFAVWVRQVRRIVGETLHDSPNVAVA